MPSLRPGRSKGHRLCEWVWMGPAGREEGWRGARESAVDGLGSPTPWQKTTTNMSDSRDCRTPTAPASCQAVRLSGGVNCQRGDYAPPRLRRPRHKPTTARSANRLRAPPLPMYILAKLPTTAAPCTEDRHAWTLAPVSLRPPTKAMGTPKARGFTTTYPTMQGALLEVSWEPWAATGGPSMRTCAHT